MSPGTWRLFAYGTDNLLAEDSETAVWELAAKLADPVTVAGPLGGTWHLHLDETPDEAAGRWLP